MIIVTEGAKSIVRELARAALTEAQGLRLETARALAGPNKRVVMSGEELSEGDEAVKHEGELLIYVSRKVSAAHDGCVVDLELSPKGLALSIGPPPLAGLEVLY